MDARERRATAGLAAVFALRMLGMFLVLPVFVLYADGLPGATPLLVGLALGSYGLTQGLLQLPFGWASDRWGRKPLLLAGLALFAAGSVLAAVAPDIGWTLAGRALQGAGAVAAVVTALLADLTRDDVRTRAMAAVGVSIGVAFAAALVLGPWLGAWIGVRGIFWLTAGLAVAGMGVVVWVVPPEGSRTEGRSHDLDLRAVLSDASLWHLNLGIFALHFILTALFVALPPALQAFGIAHGAVYLPVLAGSALLMLPAVLAGDRPAWQRPLRLGAIVLLAAALVALAVAHRTLWPLGLALLAFFTAFNFLEASLPAAVARTAAAAGRGSALGVYSTCQFLGAFAGGAAAGAAFGNGGSGAVFWTAAALAAAWSAFALLGTRRPVPGRAVRAGDA